jgi:dipeptidyl aminopeptidase/acylaminoacyl peptidase
MGSTTVRCFVLGLFATLLWTLTASAAEQSPPAALTTPQPRKIPTADFAQPSLISQPSLSPDGTKIMSRFNADEKKESILIRNVVGGELKFIAIPAKNDLRWYKWAGNNRVLLSLSQTIPWYDDEAEMTRLISYDVSTQKFLVLGKKSEGLEGDDLLYTDPSGDWILLSIQKTIYDYPSVFRVNLADNKMTEVVKPRSDVWEWYADEDGIVRAGIGFDDSSWSMVYRKTAADKFRKLGKAKYDDEDAAYDVIRFSRNSDDGFILSNKETGRYALYKFNYATKAIGERVFASDTNDVTDFSTNDDGTALRAIWYTDERDRMIWFDPKIKQIQADIDTALKQNENWIISRSRDNDRMIVWTGASNNPGIYYYYQMADGTLRKLSVVNTKVKASELSRTRYVHYKARDGLEIPAYLTLPLGRSDKNLPLVILPHGGPYDVRDTPDFSAEVQFLANRGYVVLQPNYRGSGGYGKAFYEKGEGQWGRQMQDDLDDGMDWLAKDGVIDPKRVCIIGSSYGGYAALWGATRNPERYRCAASFAGVSDLGRQLKYQINFRISKRYRKDWHKTVQGAPDFDTKTVSPLYKVGQLKVPVLIVHGDADQTVPYKQSKLYADALAKAGKTYEFHTYKEEGHGFSTSGNLQDWLDRLDAFLTKYNPAN